MAKHHHAHHLPNFKTPIIGIALVVASIAVAGMFLVSRYAAIDLSRDMRSWQDKLNLIADSRAHEVEEWVNRHFTELKKLADNPSLQIYFAQLKSIQDAQGAPILEEPAQKAYLRNLLIFTADRMGFAPESVPLSLQLPTQIPFKSGNGLAVLDNDSNIVVNTPFLEALSDDLRARIRNIPPGMQMLIDLQKNAEGKPEIGFVVPVFAIQADPTASEQMGRVVGIKQVGEGLFSLLKHPGVTEKTLEAILVRVEGSNIVYLSPLADGSGALEKQLANTPQNLAEAFAVANPGGFGERRDYQSSDVLVTGRAIPGTPWTLVVKVNRAEALAESQIRRSGMIALLLTILGLIVATVVAVWYVASSRRAKFASKYFKELAEKATAQERLITLVTDNQPELVYLLDEWQHYRFVNRKTAQEAGMDAQSMVGKKLSDVLGTARAEEVADAAEEAQERDRQVARIKRVNTEGEERIYRCEHIPLEDIPVPGLARKTAGVLVVEQDISEVVHEREARIRSHKQLVDTLVMLVDKRDPHAANHSLMVSQVAYEVATAMELEPELRETARLAGLLMNIGKIVVPEHVLTKRDSLSEQEMRSIRDSIYASAALLKDISFDGPVVETLRQSQEHWNGSGPQGVQGEGILITARIIAVTNAFVGMISPRSYRAALPIDSATKLLLENVDTIYDRKVVIALVNFIENQGGRILLNQWTQERGAA